MIISTILILLCAWSFLGILSKSKYWKPQIYQTLTGLACLMLSLPGLGIALWILLAFLAASQEIKNG